MNLSRCCLIVLSFMLVATSAWADELTHLWSQSFGDSTSQYCSSLAVDDIGNVLLAGYFWGTVDFGGGPLTDVGEYDIFLAKFDPSGTHLWSQSFGDSASQSSYDVAVDDAGNVLLTGRFEGTVDFGGGPLTSAGAGDVFLAKLDPDGDHLWSQRFGDSASQSSYGVVVDGSGNVLLTGTFGSTVDFGGGPLTSAGQSDIFLVKFDTGGNHLWSQSFGDSEYQNGISVAVDGSESVLLTGYFYGTVDFGGGPLQSAGDYDIYLAKFDPSGNHIWSQSFGDPAWQFGISVATDGSENVLLTGYFEGTVDFGGGPLVNGGQWDIFLAKFDPSGNHLWSQSFGDWRAQPVRSVAVDGAGNVLLTGEFFGTVDFGGGPLTTADGGGTDIFLAKFDPDGHHLFSQRFGDSGPQCGKSVAVDRSGDVLLTGDFFGSVDFGGGPLTSAGGPDIFLAKFGCDEPTPVLLSRISARELDLSVELSWVVSPDVDVEQLEIYRSTSPRAEEARRLAILDARPFQQDYAYVDEGLVPGETYYYWIGVTDYAGDHELFGPFGITFSGSKEPLLLSSGPNPIVDETTIRFYAPKPCDATLEIYGPTGQRVRYMGAEGLGPGTHSFIWDRRDQQGRLVATGTYFFSVRVGQTELTGKKLMILR